MTKSIQLLSIMIFATVLAFAFALVSTASAQMPWPMPTPSSESVYVDNTNDASVTNHVYVGARTGDNDAEGGDGDDAGQGGSATADGGVAIGGNGGNGGTGGVGGHIGTGNAVAIGTVQNDINSNTTRVVGCGCDTPTSLTASFMPPFFGQSSRGQKVSVDNINRATVENHLKVGADTGDNDAEGGDGDDGAAGGSATASRALSFWWWMTTPANSSATGGSGGQGGNGAAAGVITTGVSQADGLVTNVVNRNITRVLR